MPKQGVCRHCKKVLDKFKDWSYVECKLCHVLKEEIKRLEIEVKDTRESYLHYRDALKDMKEKFKIRKKGV